ncbi:MAG: hypothetical protein WBQ94_18350 [Terracidiphilus sp.]
MGNHGGLLALAVCLTFAGTQAAASAASLPSMATKKISEPDGKLTRNTQTSASSAPVHKSHLFPVNDEKGLLLTCTAPDIETNAETDLFEDCTLAPGRTLNDVVHSFVGAMHSEERQRAQERTEWFKNLDEKASQTAGKK